MPSHRSSTCLPGSSTATDSAPSPVSHDCHVPSISDPSELETWLGERYHFEGGHLARAEQSPDGAVTLTLEQYLRLGRRPGDISEVEVFELRAGTPLEFEVTDWHDRDEFVESVDVHARGGRLVIQIDLGRGRLRVVADEVTVRNIATHRRRTKPWVNDELAVAAVTGRTDRYWAARVSETLGTSVVWRVLGGREPRRAGLDPDGCFLQLLSRLATTDYGVMCTQSSNGIPTTLVRYGNEDGDAELWQAVRLVAADFGRIRCGNCVFDSADWLAYLDTGEFPPDGRLRGSIIS